MSKEKSPMKTITVAGETLTDEKLCVKLEELRGEWQHREEERKNAEREYYYEAMDYVSTSGRLEEQWYCPPELMSNRVLLQMIDMLEELVEKPGANEQNTQVTPQKDEIQSSSTEPKMTVEQIERTYARGAEEFLRQAKETAAQKNNR